MDSFQWLFRQRKFRIIPKAVGVCVHKTEKGKIDRLLAEILAIVLVAGPETGTGKDVSIARLAEIIAEVVGYQGRIV